MSAQQQGNIAGPTNKEAFAFVQKLALEMSAGKIEIPSFRCRRAYPQGAGR